MKRFVLALAGLLLLVSTIVPADASWNIRQKGNGSTVWTDGSVEVPTGPGQIVVPISSFANAVTYYVVSHKPGKVKKVYAVNNNAFNAQSAAPTFDVSISPGAQAGFTPISVGSTLTMTTASFAGRSSSLSMNEASLNLLQGYVIAIKVGSSGGGTVNGVPGSVTIVIE